MAVPVSTAVRPHFTTPHMSSTVTTTFQPPSITATGGIGQTKALSLKQITVSCENIQVSLVKRDAVIYGAELEINSLPTSVCEKLIRSPFHAQLGSLTGAHITVKGKYFSPDQKSKLLSAGRTLPFRALYLDITAQNLNSVEAALNHLSTAITTAIQSQSTPNTTSNVVTVPPVPQIPPSYPPMSISHPQIHPVPITVPQMPPLPPFLGQMPISATSVNSEPPLRIMTSTGQTSLSFSAFTSMNNAVGQNPIMSDNDLTRSYQTTSPSEEIMRPSVNSGGFPNNLDVSQSSNFSFKPIEERLPIGIATAPPSFSLITKLRGQNNVNINYIESQSGCDISVRGFGSGFREPITHLESLEPMYFFISAKDQSGLEIAKGLLKSLIETTKRDLREHLDQLVSMPRAPPAPWNS